jgi:hypothetical protein
VLDEYAGSERTTCWPIRHPEVEALLARFRANATPSTKTAATALCEWQESGLQHFLDDYRDGNVRWSWRMSRTAGWFECRLLAPIWQAGIWGRVEGTLTRMRDGYLCGSAVRSMQARETPPR